MGRTCLSEKKWRRDQVIQQSYRLRETDHARYLVIPEFEEAGAVHFFGLKASFQKSPDGLACFNGTRVMTTQQVHQDRILVLEGRPWNQGIWFTQEEAGNDAIITREAGFFVGIYTADCLPILLMDPRKKVVAAVHAGWRGSLLRVVAKTAWEMIRKLDCRPEDILAAAGPCIGPCCYEVGEVVLASLRELYPDGSGMVRLKEHGKGMLNLLELNRLQLLEVGLRQRNLYAVGLCTYCHQDLFSSYRREGKVTAGMLSGIMQAG
jgi:YfiH family protein